MQDAHVRLTPERELEIRAVVAVRADDLGRMGRELLSEIDALRLENANNVEVLADYETTNARSVETNDSLRAELASLREDAATPGHGMWCE